MLKEPAVVPTVIIPNLYPNHRTWEALRRYCMICTVCLMALNPKHLHRYLHLYPCHTQCWFAMNTAFCWPKRRNTDCLVTWCSLQYWFYQKHMMTHSSSSICRGRRKSVLLSILAVVKAESCLCIMNSTNSQVASCLHVEVWVEVVVRQLGLKAYQLNYGMHITKKKFKRPLCQVWGTL